MPLYLYSLPEVGILVLPKTLGDYFHDTLQGENEQEDILHFLLQGGGVIAASYFAGRVYEVCRRQGGMQGPGACHRFVELLGGSCRSLGGQ